MVTDYESIAKELEEAFSRYNKRVLKSAFKRIIMRHKDPADDIDDVIDVLLELKVISGHSRYYIEK